MNGAQADAIRAHVGRITSSELFAGAERLCRFLRFTVESKLAGRDAQVKEYVIGREVFDRGDDYDPRVDPIVRVEARRLRWRLAEYYGGPGRNEPLRLEYPKGGYLPVVRPAHASQEVPRKPHAVWIAGVAAFALIVAIVAFAVNRSPSPPVFAPIPLTWIQPDDGSLDAVDVVLAEDVDAELANLPGTHVIAWPEIARKKSLRLLALRDYAGTLGANSLVLILVRGQGSNRIARIFVVDEPSGRKHLALTYVRPTIETFAQQNALAARIVGDLNPLLKSSR